MDKLERVSELSMEDEVGLGFAVQWIHRPSSLLIWESALLDQKEWKKFSEVDTGISVPQKRSQTALQYVSGW